jgi:hypothetical protein
MTDKLEEKAKTIKISRDWSDSSMYFCSYGHLAQLVPELHAGSTMEVTLVRLEVAQQEIDKEKEIYHVLWEKYDNLNELFQSLMTLACEYYDDTEGECGLLKQKLREFWKWLEQKAWRGVSSEVIDEFGERFEELLK